ncbi:hypothetical protein HQ576_03575 [bacterium]|nr:hypothetical protein [bacterium]
MNRAVIAMIAVAVLLPAPLALGAEPAPAEDEEAYERLVVTHDKTPFMYGKEKIGELAEGTLVQLRETRADWAKVRVAFDGNWIDGWIRSALTVTNSLRDANITVAPPKRVHVYEGLALPGMQFLEVRVKYESSARGPSRIYFRWDDEKTADIFLTYGRNTRVLPYGHLRPKPMSTRRIFDRTVKRQVLLVPAKTRLIETYVFAVPVRAKNFDLILKDTTHELTEKR